MSFLKRISLRLKHIHHPPVTFHVNRELHALLQEIAHVEHKPIHAVMSELLHDAAIARRQAHQNLRLWDDLSPREKQVAALTCMERTNYEIAEQMVISPNTVKTHMRRILDKCGVNSKAELRKVLSLWDFQEWLDGQYLREQLGDPPTSSPSPDEATPQK